MSRRWTQKASVMMEKQRGCSSPQEELNLGIEVREDFLEEEEISEPTLEE